MRKCVLAAFLPHAASRAPTAPPLPPPADAPRSGFLPATGTLRHLSPPRQSPHVRVDTGVRQGDAVSIFYDPMISKLIT